VNAWPLTEGLRGLPGVVLDTAPPSDVARRLRTGAADVGLVPSIELLRQNDIVPVGTAGIAAFGAVDSVLVLLRRAPHRVRTLALDPASRTSQTLATIVFERVFGVRPDVHVADPRVAWRDGVADAVLVIGDVALEFWKQSTPAIDLAEAWSGAFGLPFVFAVWAARKEALARHPELPELLDAARIRGVARIGVLARRAALRGPLDEAAFQVYLTRRIRYGLGPSERQGLATFLELARCSISSSSETIPTA
jgi:chorismate dehydratase